MTVPVETNDPTNVQPTEPETSTPLDGDVALRLYSGKGWTPSRKDGIETFTSPGGELYVRARPDEDADVIVSFPNTRGLSPLHLVLAGESATVKRAERKKRRELRELRRRGYDV